MWKGPTVLNAGEMGKTADPTPWLWLDGSRTSYGLTDSVILEKVRWLPREEFDEPDEPVEPVEPDAVGE